MLSSGDVIAASGAMAHPIKLITYRADYASHVSCDRGGKRWVEVSQGYPPPDLGLPL
jgi:hypothetical protein